MKRIGSVVALGFVLGTLQLAPGESFAAEPFKLEIASRTAPLIGRR